MLLNTTFYVVDFCIISHFCNPLTHAAHIMSYFHDILNLGYVGHLAKSDTFPVPLRVRLIGS